jgi:hypothetical protein
VPPLRTQPRTGGKNHEKNRTRPGANPAGIGRRRQVARHEKPVFLGKAGFGGEGRMNKPDYCVWKPDRDGNWETTCGNLHYLYDATPHQSGYEFCPWCGKKLAQTEGEDDE